MTAESGLSREQLLPKRVGVLLGGLSEEREISLKTGTAVAVALRSIGYSVVEIDAGADLPQRLLEEKLAVAFNALHGRYGEDGCVQGMLEVLRIPYTGSGVLGSTIAMNKIFSKRLFEKAGLPTSEWRVVKRAETGAATVHSLGLPLPLVVKPERQGSSIGVSIVREESALREALEKAASFGGHVLVEKFVAGAEVCVGILGEAALGAIEVVPAREFYDYSAKYNVSTTRYIYPARLPPEQYQRALEAGLAAHQAIGCESYSRVDMIVSPAGQFAVLEVNTLPGMTERSLLPKIAAGVGISFPQLIERILLMASLKA